MVIAKVKDISQYCRRFNALNIFNVTRIRAIAEASLDLGTDSVFLTRLHANRAVDSSVLCNRPRRRKQKTAVEYESGCGSSKALPCVILDPPFLVVPRTDVVLEVVHNAWAAHIAHRNSQKHLAARLLLGEVNSGVIKNGHLPHNSIVTPALAKHQGLLCISSPSHRHHQRNLSYWGHCDNILEPYVSSFTWQRGNSTTRLTIARGRVYDQS